MVKTEKTEKQVKKAHDKYEKKVDKAKVQVATLVVAQDLYVKAGRLVEQKHKAFIEKLKKSKDGEFHFTLLSKGTATDKISALAMLVQKDAVSTHPFLEQLLGLTKKHNRKQAEQAVTAFKDLFLQGYMFKLHEKLYVFQRNPVIMEKREKCTDEEIVQAYHEHCIRELLREFCSSTLLMMGKAELDFQKTTALDITAQMLPYARVVDMKEQLINMIVNKFGDASKKIQCHAINTMVRVLTRFHGDSKEEVQATILREVSLFLTRPGCKPSHRIYSLGFLNKAAGIVIGSGSIDMRHTILSIYFNLFNQLLHQGPKNTEVVVPAKKDRKVSKEKRIKAEKALARKKLGSVDEEDNKVIELVLKGINVVLVKSSTQLDSELRKLLENQTNMLFKLTHHKVFRIQLQTLKLLFQFAKSSSKLGALNVTEDTSEPGTGGSFADRFYRTLYETLQSVQLTKNAKLDEFFGLVFRAVRADNNVKRVAAYLKRLLQMCFVNESNFGAATLLVISELLKVRKDVAMEVFKFNAMVSEGPAVISIHAQKPKEEKEVSDSDSDEENFQDVDRVLEEKKTAIKKVLNVVNKQVAASKYDPLKREPQYCNALDSPLWELAALVNHSHPTICFWAEQLAKGQSIVYEGDPLLDFGLGNFLDRIAYKQPKTSEQSLKFRQRMAQFEQPVNSINFQGGEVPENARIEEQFMYKFMEMRPEKIAKKPQKDSDEEGDDIDFESDEDPELEKFANDEMQKEMKKMAQGAPGGMPDTSDEEISQEGGDSEGGESEDEDGGEGDGFFSGEDDLQEIELEKDDEDQDEDDEGEDLESYGSAAGSDAGMDVEEDENGEGSDLPEEEETKAEKTKKSRKRNRDEFEGKDIRTTKSGARYASYEDFAALLEGDAEAENDSFKDKKQSFTGKNYSAQKRRRTK